ncbi:MAG: cadherin-like beta sandwich domain-containing protein [Reichenbachiella sp.]
MKNFTILLLMLIVSIKFSNAQISTITFEPGEDGNDWSWNTFENDDNPALELVTNPNTTGVNTSSTTAKFTAKATGAQWAGVESAHGDFGPMTLSETNSTVKIMVLKTVISDVGIKFTINNGGAQGEIKVSNTVVNEWEELTFDFSSQIGTVESINIDQIVIFPDFAGRAQNNTIYFDNISFSAKSDDGGSSPTIAAPTPTVAAADVISIFSDAYSDIASTNFNPDWGQSTIQTTEIIESNATLKYDNFNFQGTQLGSTQDLSSKDYIHIDLWTSNATTVNIFLISISSGEKSVALDIVSTQWKSIDIPLTDFTSQGLSLTDIHQLKFDGTEGSTIYLDNIYFYDLTIQEGTDATLSDLKVDGISVNGFSSNELNYTLNLDEGTTEIPTVTATTTDVNARIDITPTTKLPGITNIEVTSEDGSTKSTYTVEFTIIPELALPIDFEAGPYDFIDFDGGTATVIDNPQSSGTNTSSSVAQIVRNGGAQWAGSKIKLTDPIDFSVNNTFSMNVFSPKANITVKLKLEGNGAADERDMITSVANEWETLSFDFTGSNSSTYDDLVFMFDFGTVGDGSINSTFLFDDIILFDITGGLDQIDLPVDFESSMVFYELTDFGDALTELGEDPINANNTVGITTKHSGAATWAGTTVGTNKGFKSRIPFTETETFVNMKVYSPRVGTKIRMKVEDHNDVTLTAETEVVTTISESWEILNFDFSHVAEGTNPFNPTTNFDKLSIFFDFGNEGTGATYYWDNIEFGENNQVTNINSDFSSDIQVYASQGILNISCRESINDFEIQVHSLLGKTILKKRITQKNERIRIPENGILIIGLIDHINGTTQTFKIFAE